ISIPQIALIFSVICAALRYHTADTMSHGLAALCSAGALALTLRSRDAIEARLRGRAIALAAGAGLAAGWLFATRPVSALALGPILALAVRRTPAVRPVITPITPITGLTAGVLRTAGFFTLGMIPGVALFLAHQHA